MISDFRSKNIIPGGNDFFFFGWDAAKSVLSSTYDNNIQFFLETTTMSEKTTAENLLNNLVEALADSVPNQKSASFFEEGTSSVTSQFNRLFGREKPVHHLLGGGKCRIIYFSNAFSKLPINFYTFMLSHLSFYENVVAADVLLWRNKKISASVLSGATAIWVLFEWLNYHLLTLICIAVVLGMLAQFVWTNASGLFSRWGNWVLVCAVCCIWVKHSNFCPSPAWNEKFFIATGPHLRSPALWYLMRHLSMLGDQLALRLTMLCSFFRMYHVEEVWNNFWWYVCFFLYLKFSFPSVAHFIIYKDYSHGTTSKLLLHDSEVMDSSCRITSAKS